MPKISITSELASTLKNIRLQNSVKAITIAKQLNKSGAYISKLEDGKIKSIDYENLLEIIETITNNNKDFDKVVDDIYNGLNYKFSPEEIQQEIWLENFDLIERQIPVPFEIINYINQRIINLGIDLDFLIEEINRNEELENEKNIPDKYGYNLWNIIDKGTDGNFSSFIIMKLDKNDISILLNESEPISNYTTVYCLIYTLFKIEYKNNGVELNDEIRKDLKNETVRILNQNKFYSNIERIKQINSANNLADLESKLSDFDIKNRDIITEILNHFAYLSERNIKYANEKLVEFLNNLEWDNSFTLALSGLEFYKLGGISVTQKKTLLEDINSIIEKYNNLPESNKNIETY